MPFTSSANIAQRRVLGKPGFRESVAFCALLLLAELGSTGFSATNAAPPSQTHINFNFQVRPILADRCFPCHGPDEKARKAKLRLDLKESAFAIRGEPASPITVLSPGHPEKSELVRRIESTDEEERMPPSGSKLSLSAEEIQLLGRWVQEGADYQRHWAFIPVGEVSIPAVSNGSAMRNPIDAFVQARLQKQGLRPSAPADRTTLVRRLSFDLRGLPPSLDEIDQFLADQSPGAYERLVDRLLASPAYGEKQARQWLDLARYADTYGYQADVECELWPWRDWVINAFNQNLSYDQFITWQLAGDLLPHSSREQIVATAFNRLHRQTNEGGSVEEEFRAEYVADRVSTASTAFLGLTMTCARCHDHKYDPITQKDFYRFSAFFNNIDESGLYSHFTHATPTPTLLMYTAEQEKAHRAAVDNVTSAVAILQRALESAAPRCEAWLDSGTNLITAPLPVASYDFEQIENGKTPNSLGTNAPGVLVDSPQLVPGHDGQALHFSGDNYAEFKGLRNFGRTDPFSFSLWLKPAEKHDRAVVVHQSRAWTDSGSRGFELLLEQGTPSFALIHFWPGNALKVRATNALPVGQWSHLTVTYDGSSRAQGIHVYLDGSTLPLEIVRDHLTKDILHRAPWGDADVGNIHLTLAGRFRDAGFRNGTIDQFEVFDRCLTPGEIKVLLGQTNALTRSDFVAAYTTLVDPACRAAAQELHQARVVESKSIEDVREVMVMREMTERRPTHLLKRGAYDAPGEIVEPGTPDSILPFSAQLPPNRLGLAQWMVSRSNPLTARVVVNRVWSSHFGRGLVATEEDFGIRGRLPTHPDLLDWLAGWFMENGWDLKALHKLIVLSATYRQSSTGNTESLAADPENLWLARGPKQRLSAEAIRDEALAISGLLSPRIGGPSVRPYQPEGLWEQSGTGKTYVQDKGEALYRRSLYTFWRRTAPPPSMLIFDAPTREVCTARREVTSTPLQALVLLNDPQFVEASRVIGESLVREFGHSASTASDATAPARSAGGLPASDSDISQQRAAGKLLALLPDAALTKLFRLVIGRPPSERELPVLRRLYSEQLEHFQNDPAAAAKYLKIGERSVDTDLPASQVAATTVLANACMNLDEFSTTR